MFHNSLTVWKTDWVNIKYKNLKKNKEYTVFKEWMSIKIDTDEFILVHNLL